VTIDPKTLARLEKIRKRFNRRLNEGTRNAAVKLAILVSGDAAAFYGLPVEVRKDMREALEGEYKVALETVTHQAFKSLTDALEKARAERDASLSTGGPGHTEAPTGSPPSPA
jgi:hypothetical protein